MPAFQPGHNHIERRERTLELDPGLSATTRCAGRRRVVGDQSFISIHPRAIKRVLNIQRDDARHIGAINAPL